MIATAVPDRQHRHTCDLRSQPQDHELQLPYQIGRRCYADRHQKQGLDGARIPSDQWWFYDWFRRTVKLTANAAGDNESLAVERALFVLGERLAREPGTGSLPWSKYYREALMQVMSLSGPGSAAN